MLRNLKIIATILCISLCQSNNIFCQNFSKSSLKYGVGWGISDGQRNTGMGWLIVLGYQRDIWKDRLRINPNITAGYFNTRYYSDARDQWFNSLNLEAILDFDIIKFKALSLTIGAGGTVNYTKGLLGYGGFPPGAITSEYFSVLNFGGLLSAGIRINPPKSRIAIDLTPLTFHIGGDSYTEVFTSLGFEIKLK